MSQIYDIKAVDDVRGQILWTRTRHFLGKNFPTSSIC